jgi:hypothetical protein
MSTRGSVLTSSGEEKLEKNLSNENKSITRLSLLLLFYGWNCRLLDYFRRVPIGKFPE